MAKPVQAVQIYCGESTRLDFTLAPVEDCAGWAIAFSASPSPGQAAVIGPVAASITDGPAGKFRVQLSAAQTTLAARSYSWEAWRTDVGQEGVLAVGTLDVLPRACSPVAP